MLIYDYLTIFYDCLIWCVMHFDFFFSDVVTISLVGGLNPSEKIWKSVELIIPNIWKNRIHVPNHQPVLIMTCFVSRMRSKGSRFTLGVCGLRVCSLDVAFASATVRNRSQPFAWGPYGRAYGKFYRGGPFWRFQTSGCFVSRGRCGTSWHSDVFCNVSQAVLRGRRNTFATFSEDVLQFSWQAQHFGRVHRHFSWQAQHFRRVLWRVFCKSHWQGCVKWWQGENSVAGVAFSDTCWKLTEASHETAILRLQIFRF